MRKSLGGVGRQVIDIVEGVLFEELVEQRAVGHRAFNERRARRNLVGEAARKIVEHHDPVP